MSLLKNHPLKRRDKLEVVRSDMSDTRYSDYFGSSYQNQLTRGYSAFYVGTVGSGKTYHLKRMVADYMEQNTHYYERRKWWFFKETVRVAPRVLTYDENAQIEEIDGYRFEDNLDGDWSEYPFQRFYNVYHLIENIRFGDIVILEELGTLTKKENELIRELMKVRRHFGIILLGTSQRPFNVEKTFFTISNDFYLFNLTDPIDIKAISDAGGADVSPSIIRDTVWKLPTGKESQHLRVHKSNLPENERIPAEVTREEADLLGYPPEEKKWFTLPVNWR